MESDEQAIREVHSTWIAAVNAGDLARLLTLMADDVVLLGPGRAPCGREGFSAVFSGAHKQLRIRCISDLEEVVIVGDLAYTRACDSLSVTPRDGEAIGGATGGATGGAAGGETAHLAGDRLTIYRKHPDGRWLLARDAHTLTPVQK